MSEEIYMQNYEREIQSLRQQLAAERKAREEAEEAHTSVQVGHTEQFNRAEDAEEQVKVLEHDNRLLTSERGECLVDCARLNQQVKVLREALEEAKVTCESDDHDQAKHALAKIIAALAATEAKGK